MCTLLRVKRKKSRERRSKATETSRTSESKITSEASRSRPTLLNPNDSVQIALQLFRFNNPLHDYNESQRKRRLKKMTQIMDKDDGPFYTNYRYAPGSRAFEGQLE